MGLLKSVVVWLDSIRGVSLMVENAVRTMAIPATSPAHDSGTFGPRANSALPWSAAEMLAVISSAGFPVRTFKRRCALLVNQ
jgi:hypothetical protein